MLYLHKIIRKNNYPIEYLLSKNLIEEDFYLKEIILKDNKIEYIKGLYYNLYYDSFYHEGNLYYDHLFLLKEIIDNNLKEEEIIDIKDYELKMFLYIINNIYNKETEDNIDYYNYLYNKIINTYIIKSKELRLNTVLDFIKRYKTFQEYITIVHSIKSNNDLYFNYIYDISNDNLIGSMTKLLDSINDKNKNIYLDILIKGIGIWQQ